MALVRESEKKPEWNEFRNLYKGMVGDFYRGRGLSRKDIVQTVGWLIGKDRCSRLGIAQGHVLEGDYWSEIEILIGEKFTTRREFCEATGLSEDMLSHVLAKRKDFAIGTLVEALDRIGYTLHVVPKVPIS